MRRCLSFGNLFLQNLYSFCNVLSQLLTHCTPDVITRRVYLQWVYVTRLVAGRLYNCLPIISIVTI